MSFYAGNFNRKKQCHITKGQHDINVMRGGPLKYVFHTDITYLDFKEFSLSNYSPYNTVFNTAILANGNEAYSPKDVTIYYISGDLWNYIQGNYSWIIYDNSNKKILNNLGFFR